MGRYIFTEGLDMNENLKGKHNSYFYNNFLVARPEDQKKGLIDSVTTDDVICRLNGYAIIPIEEYCKLRGEAAPEGTSEKIKEMNERLSRYSRCNMGERQ